MSIIQDKFKENKKLILLFAVTCVFAVYMLYPTGDESQGQDEGQELDQQLSQLQTNQNNSRTNPEPIDRSYDGTDNRGVSLGEGSDVYDPGAFKVSEPLIEGLLVGFGTKTATRGEYWVAFVEYQVEDEVVGYEIDLRNIIGYQKEKPTRWRVDDYVRVFGELTEENIIRATTMQ